MIYLGINCGFGNADCGTSTFDDPLKKVTNHVRAWFNGRKKIE
jgi:hypothetical protein